MGQEDYTTVEYHIFRSRGGLLCNCNNATEIAGVNDEVRRRMLRYDTRVEDRSDERDLGDDGGDGERW